MSSPRCIREKASACPGGAANRKLTMVLCVGAGSDPDIERAWIDHPAALGGIPILYAALVERERHQLYDLVSRAVAAVRDGGRHRHPTARLQHWCIELGRSDGEPGIAEAVPEFELRGRGDVPIALALVLGHVRGVVGIIDRDLADAARPGDRQLAAGVHVAEQGTRDRGAAARAAEPGVEDRRRALQHGSQRQRPPAHRHDDHRFAERHHRIEQLHLVAGQRQDDEVGAFGERQRGVEFARGAGRVPPWLWLGLARDRDAFEHRGHVAFQLDTRCRLHGRRAAQPVADAFEHRHRFGQVVLERPWSQHVALRIGTGADHRDMRVRARSQWQGAIVLEQHERAFGRLLCSIPMTRVCERASGLCFIDEGALEKAHRELGDQDAAYRLMRDEAAPTIRTSPGQHLNRYA
ncbi:hypothetical protein WR25_18160 [Diploscapter pachys]|uniref:Uncharacterized protein n=1 Tax=Diploscapter pachys TaxID=2018661 RepID=A0A2A2M2Z2_9BILA|nr:hypothetical protein WR25_18160 [Diploscapter pachys]